MAISKITSNSITDGAVTSDDLASGAVEQAMTTQIGGRRNLIINGAMQVAQRGTSFTGLTNGSGGYKLDRWVWGESGTTSYVFTVDQSSDSPEYFGNSFKMTCTTGATIDAGNMNRIFTSLEGQDLQKLAHGTASAKTMTLSFWVKSNQTGVMIAWFYNPTSGRDYSSQVTINSADTWEYKTVTVTGDTTGSIPNNNAIGLYVEFVCAAGTNFTSGSGALDTWDTYDGTSRARGVTLDIGATTGDYFAITGVQLEVGSVATPFEHRSYGEELALCQRYYWQTNTNDVNTLGVASAMWYHANDFRTLVPFPVTMRARPTLDQSSVTNQYRALSNNGSQYFTSFTGLTNHTIHVGGAYVTSISGTAGHAGWLLIDLDNAFLGFDAEL